FPLAEFTTIDASPSMSKSNVTSGTGVSLPVDSSILVTLFSTTRYTLFDLWLVVLPPILAATFLISCGRIRKDF
ncbi:5135_t:CDS:2, partial [Diversispora eburnea]